MVLVGSFSQIYSDRTKESRIILKVCILDKVCIFKSVDKNGIVREFSAIQKKSSGRGDGLVPTQWKENKSSLHTCTVTCNHALTYNTCMST